MQSYSVMRSDFITVPWSEDQHAADRLMRLARVRHLPVVQEDELIGVLSYRDLLLDQMAERDSHLSAPQLETLRSRPIAPLVRREVVSVSPQCSPERAAELMLRHRIGFLPVVENGRLVGIVTESDLLRAAYVGTDSSSV
jgi:CBS domain-containing protein